MTHTAKKDSRSTGISDVDRLIGHLSEGDNVIWYDSAGTLSWPFSCGFVRDSFALQIPLLYIVFDESPRDLLSKLGPLANNPHMTILDCFTWGKGKGAGTFLDFYYGDRGAYPGRVTRVDNPFDVKLVSEVLWGTYAFMRGEVRLVFESLTGMRDLWGSEEDVLNFYSKTCPRLYELNTLSYWIVKKGHLSSTVRAQLNGIAQVVIDLKVRRGKEFLVPRKTGSRGTGRIGRPYQYWKEDDNSLTFEGYRKSTNELVISRRVKEAREMRGMSQAELAHRVGVTPGAISQTESSTVLPSLRTLLKIAQVLSVEPSFFFRKSGEPPDRLVFSPAEGEEITLAHVAPDAPLARRVMPETEGCDRGVYYIEIPPRRTLPSHFLVHKGEEMGFLLSGTLRFTCKRRVYDVASGDVVYLRSNVPQNWQNPGRKTAKLLWVKL